MPLPQIREKYFFGQLLCKIRAFSGKYHKNSGILLHFYTYIFGQKCLDPPKLTLSSYAHGKGEMGSHGGPFGTRTKRRDCFAGRRQMFSPEQQQRVAVEPGNAHFISIRQVSPDAAMLRRGTCGHCCTARRRCCHCSAAAHTAFGNLLIRK